MTPRAPSPDFHPQPETAFWSYPWSQAMQALAHTPVSAVRPGATGDRDVGVGASGSSVWGHGWAEAEPMPDRSQGELVVVVDGSMVSAC